jgi:hypothetical protein
MLPTKSLATLLCWNSYGNRTLQWITKVIYLHRLGASGVFAAVVVSDDAGSNELGVLAICTLSYNAPPYVNRTTTNTTHQSRCSWLYNKSVDRL